MILVFVLGISGFVVTMAYPWCQNSLDDIRMRVRNLCLILITGLFPLQAALAQEIPSAESAAASQQEKKSRFSLLIYTRTIVDAQGNARFDQNIVPNLALTDWLNVEAGIRHGETSAAFHSYVHYKLELQSKVFWKSVRFFARMSDNVLNYPSVYSKSNYLAVTESKFPVGKSFFILASGGYVLSYQQNNLTEAAPVTSGQRNNYPTYRFGLRRALGHKGFIDAVYGAYDTFNPYLPESPFVQLGGEHELGQRWDLYTYIRYQFHNALNVPLNDFLGIGVRFH